MIWSPRDRSSWHDWYAWRPVFLEDGTLVWRETIRRRYVDVGHMWSEFKWQYCMAGDEW